jgi:hypothetical protein
MPLAFRYNQPKETGKNNYAISASDSVLTNELSRQEALLADIDEQVSIACRSLKNILYFY